MFNQLTDPENDIRIYENGFLFLCTIFILKNKRAVMVLDHSPELKLAMKVMASVE